MQPNVFVRSLSRRTWVQQSGMSIAALLLTPPLRAEEQPLDATIRSMAAVTGTVERSVASANRRPCRGHPG